MKALQTIQWKLIMDKVNIARWGRKKEENKKNLTKI